LTDRQPRAAQKPFGSTNLTPNRRRHHETVGRLRVVLGRRMRLPASGRGGDPAADERRRRRGHADDAGRPDEQASEAHAR